MSLFWGAAALMESVSIVLTNKNIISLGFQGVSDAIAGIRVSNDAVLYRRDKANYFSYAGEWMDPTDSGIVANYECRLTNNSGVAPSGASLGVWLPCNFTRDWSITRLHTSGVGDTVSSNTLEIRDAATQAVLATAGVDLTATIEA